MDIAANEIERTSAPPSTVVPSHPDAPGIPFPHVADDAYDAELEAIADMRALPARRTAMVARALAVLASLALAWALRYDLRYALSPSSPIELGSAPTSPQLSAASHRYVGIDGIPGGVGAIDYRRPLHDGLYRLAPLVDHPDIYVELELPAGTDPTRFVPPTKVHGRLVPLDEGGARFKHVRAMIETATGHPAPATFLLEAGSEPSPTSPAPLVAILALFAGITQLGMLGASLRSKRSTT